jgi:hypothetical protein
MQHGAVALSPYFLTAINNYRIEYDAEVHRERFHSIYPSRLSAIYAFADYETCIAVNKKYDWPLSEAHRFRLIEHPLNRVVKVNMEQRQNFDSGVIWEYLIEGAVERIKT